MVKPISAKIHLISVNSDLLFLSHEDKFTFEKLKKIKKKCTYSEVNSIHGHDAFLIENEQIKNILRSIF